MTFKQRGQAALPHHETPYLDNATSTMSHLPDNSFVVDQCYRYPKDDAMKVRSILTLVITLFVVFAFSVRAQEKKSAAETAEDLRAQLSEVQAKEAELQARVKQLDEDLKPENIERFFAGVGSTKPEDLRALRRSQLEREKASVLNQLDQLAGRRARLETAILKADSAAYQQSAQGVAPSEQLMAAQSSDTPRWMIALAGFVALLGVGSLIAVVRKVRKS